MKKNLISIIILALLVVNIVLSAITLFSVAGTNKKTAALVTDIASAIKLDLETGERVETAATVSVPMEFVVTYDITEMIIPLKKSAPVAGADGEMSVDNKDHYVQISLTLSMNSEHEDYATYSDLTTRESLIKGEINDVVAGYTIEEMRDRETINAIESEVLTRIQALFDSEFIYNVTVTSALPQ